MLSKYRWTFEQIFKSEALGEDHLRLWEYIRTIVEPEHQTIILSLFSLCFLWFRIFFVSHVNIWKRIFPQIPFKKDILCSQHAEREVNLKRFLRIKKIIN
jgi:hypothetical protein